MEKRSSLKDSGLSFLFRPTEPAAPAGQESSPAGSTASGEERPEALQTFTGGPDPGRTVAGVEERSEGESSRSNLPTDEARRTLIPPSRSFPAVIRVVGVGGAGTNAVNRMVEAGLHGVEFIAINTDAQALAMCEADHKLRIGKELTKGLGGGSDPKVGLDAALAAYEEIKSVLRGSDMVFITAGEGGGTGTGAAPVVAEISRSLGALTIGVVTRPFSFEGKKRCLQALEGIRALRQRADTVIVVPNDKLLEVADRRTTMVEALRLADDVLRQGVQGICDLVTVPGLINLDLADVRTIMTGAGTAHMGIGQARGEGRAKKAAEMALNSSLLESSVCGARGILLNVSGGPSLSLYEITEVADVVGAAADPEANIIFGAVVDESLGDSVRVTVVAAGFEATSEEIIVAEIDQAVREGRPAEKEAAEEARADQAEKASPTLMRPIVETLKSDADELEIPPFLR